MDQLKQLLESHDWHYQRSDDHRVWKRGSEQRAAILNLVGAIGEEADQLFKSYHQQEFPEVYQS